MEHICNWCKSEAEDWSEEYKSWKDSNACSSSCRQALNRMYDNYVDPSGFYQAKAMDPDE